MVATSRKTRGGITAVLRLLEQSDIWKKYHCHWIETHRDGSKLCKLWYLSTALIEYGILLPFYDIVHIHFSIKNSARRKYIFFQLAKIFHKKIVIHLHCGTQIDAIWSSIYQRMFTKCDVAIVLSGCSKKRIEYYVGKNIDIEVVYNPCPVVKRFTQNVIKKNYILFSGTLYEGKGYKDLIRAFAKIAKKFPEWKVVFAGNGEIEIGRDLANSLGIGQQVIFCGWVHGEDKDRLFRESQVLCLPSYAEGFPMAVLDAWAYTLAVITTPVGGIPDVAVDGENILLFDSGDVDELSVKLEMIISSNKLRKKISDASRDFSRGMFSLDNFSNSIDAIYRKLLC